jgi:DNA-binding transcriptional LysR family regulator
VTTGTDRDLLDAFVVVAREGSVRVAAERLGRTQPSVSARIAKLEAAWKVRLFSRRPRGMVPTPEGRRLLPIATRALAALDELDREAGHPVSAPEELRVGAGDAVGRELLPAALRTIARETPGLAARVVEGPRERLLAALRGGEIDVALVFDPADGSGPAGAAADLEVEPLARSEVIALVPSGAPGTRRRLRLADLAGVPLVTLQAGSSFRLHLERALARSGLALRPAVEVGSLSLVRRYVAAGLGVAPVPAIAFGGRGGRIAGVRTVPIVEIETLRYVSVRRAGAPLPGVTSRLLEVLAARAS